jgi:hypothetical protein
MSKGGRVAFARCDQQVLQVFDAGGRDDLELVMLDFAG